jgi:hypothetical protein
LTPLDAKPAKLSANLHRVASCHISQDCRRLAIKDFETAAKFLQFIPTASLWLRRWRKYIAEERGGQDPSDEWPKVGRNVPKKETNEYGYSPDNDL